MNRFLRTAALAFGVMMVLCPPEARADEKLTGPLDLQSMVNKALDPVENSNRSLDDYQKMLKESDGSMMSKTLAGIISHPWPITRALVWGLTNTGLAVDRLGESEERIVGTERTSFTNKSKAGSGTRRASRESKA